MNYFEDFLLTNNLTTSQISRYLMVSPSYLCMVKKDKTKLSVENLAKLKENEDWDTLMLPDYDERTFPLRKPKQDDLGHDNEQDDKSVRQDTETQNSEEKPMSEGERIQYIIDTLCGGSAIAFAQSIGISKTRLSKIVHGHCRLAKLYDAILREYPDINSVWLRTGKGYPGDLAIWQVREKYEKIIEEKDRLIMTLQRVIEEALGSIENSNKCPKMTKG